MRKRMDKGICLMRIPRYVAPAVFGLGLFLTVSQVLAQDADAPARPARQRPPARIVWAAQPVPETPYVAPNKLIWRLADVLAAHKGKQSWSQQVVHTRDFDGYYISMAPGEKTKSMFYSDDRVMWWVASGQMRVTIDVPGLEPFVATKGFLVDVAPRANFSVENTGSEPVVMFQVRPAGEKPSYPVSETPTPVKGWKYVEASITDQGSYADGHKPYLDFLKEVVAVDGKSSNFVYDGHTSAHVIRGPGVDTPPPDSLGHFHENMVEFWCVLEGRLDVLVSGEKLVTGDVGDIILAPNERWHRATSHPGGPSTRLAITPRLKEGQVHYTQTNGQGGN
jgi:mannose-6-phosphate isomerase-like protein (cupin superfamily)